MSDTKHTAPDAVQQADWLFVVQTRVLAELVLGADDAGHIAQQAIRVPVSVLTIGTLNKKAGEFIDWQLGRRGRPAWLVEELEICG